MVGDLVIGEVVQIQGKSWLVDIGSYQLANLSIQSIHIHEIQVI